MHRDIEHRRPNKGVLEEGEEVNDACLPGVYDDAALKPIHEVMFYASEVHIIFIAPGLQDRKRARARERTGARREQQRKRKWGVSERATVNDRVSYLNEIPPKSDPFIFGSHSIYQSHILCAMHDQKLCIQGIQSVTFC